jgi:hypothetical protein
VGQVEPFFGCYFRQEKRPVEKMRMQTEISPDPVRSQRLDRDHPAAGHPEQQARVLDTAGGEDE